MVQNILTVNDFNRILDNFSGRQVEHTPVVQTISNLSGQETLTEGTTVTIKCHFMRTGQNWDYGKQGFLEKGDAVMLSKYADSIVKNSIITEGGLKYRVKEAYNVPGVYDSTGSGTTYVYTACNLFLIE